MDLQNVVPEKSPNDQREYQAIQLPNKLKILFIQDPKAEKAACSVSVGVGSLMDGERSLGLAHFLEHMLFMGSRKFPIFNEYSEFMSLNSGYDNAYTSDEETNYQFQISNSNFPSAVERLSDFFVKALLTSTCIEKQRQAVHEECMLRFSEDNSRKWQILKHFASGPYHNHSIGNNNTLSHPKVEEDLVNFYNNEYSANRITAVLLSAMPITEMKEKLLPFFEEITNKNLKEIQYETHFRKENIGKLVRMQSIKDEVLMEFFWVTDSVRPYYKWHPERYITHVIGHEGKNSLLSLLKAKDWASQIVSYSHDLPKQTIFGLEVHLTEQGEEQYEAVYSLVTQYVASLKAEHNIYEEIKEAAAVEFQFKEKGSNFNYVRKLSDHLHRIPMNQVLSWKSKYNEFKADIIDKFLQSLKPQNVIVVYSRSEQLQNPITQKHLGGKFVVEELPKIKSKGEKFQPLLKNPFLPLNTDLVKAQVKVPIKEKGIWFVQGDFGVCKGGIRLKIQKPESQIFMEFYSDYLDLLLKEITYQAESLQLSVEIECQDGFTIGVYGYSHTVQKLFEEISPLITKVHQTTLGEQLFKLNLQTLQEEYSNFYQGEVDEITEELLNIATKSTGTPVEDRIKELQAYKYKAIAKRIDDFWKTAKMEWVVVGNFEKERIIELLKNFEKTVGSDSTSPQQQISYIKLKKGTPVTNITFLESEDIGTSSVIMYKQIGQYDELKYYTLFLLHNYIKVPFFDKLRTQQQLAYYLAAFKVNNRGILGLNFLLISSNTNPNDISGHITNFINDFLAKTEQDLTEDKFETLKKSVRSQVLKPFQSLQEYYKFILKEIDNGTFCFDRKTNAVQLEGYLSQIKREDVVRMLKECLDLNLQIWVVSEPHKEEFLKTNIQGQTFKQIKEAHQFYPDTISQKQ